MFRSNNRIWSDTYIRSHNLTIMGGKVVPIFNQEHIYIYSPTRYTWTTYILHDDTRSLQCQGNQEPYHV